MVKQKFKTLYRYEFPIRLSGVGTTPEEAWEDAFEAFMQDPGSYDKAIKKEPIQ